MRHCLRVFCGLYLGYPTESTKVVNSSHGGYCLTRLKSQTAWEGLKKTKRNIFEGFCFFLILNAVFCIFRMHIRYIKYFRCVQSFTFLSSKPNALFILCTGKKSEVVRSLSSNYFRVRDLLSWFLFSFHVIVYHVEMRWMCSLNSNKVTKSLNFCRREISITIFGLPNLTLL